MTRLTKKQEDLSSIYFNPNNPASFSSIEKLFVAAKAKNNNITFNDVKNFLSNTSTFTSHKPVSNIFVRRKTIVGGINDQWQLDLIDISSLKKHNHQIRYLLAAIDCFSRYAYVEPLNNKTAKETTNAFKKILKKVKKFPNKIQTDDGSEFKGEFKHLLKKLGIHHFTTSQDTKCSLVERFNRTLQGKLYKYMSAANTLHYLDSLQTIVHAYNNSKHRILGMNPAQVSHSNEQELWNKLYKNHLYSTKNKSKFKKNDKVRILKYKKTFKRGYLPSWTKEIFQIAFRLKTEPETYVLLDKNNEILKGSFYKEELVKIKGA